MLVMATLLLQCVPPMRCSARLSTATSLWVFLHSAYYLITEKNRLLIEIRWLMWVLEDIPFFLPWETLGLILEYALGRYLFTLWTTVRSVFQHLAEFEHFRINSAIFISSCIIGKHLRCGSTGSHTCPCHNVSSTAGDMACFRSQSVLLLLPS